MLVYSSCGCTYTPWTCSWHYLIARDTGGYTTTRQYGTLAYWYSGNMKYIVLDLALVLNACLFYFVLCFFACFVLFRFLLLVCSSCGCTYTPWTCSWHYLVARDTGRYTTTRQYGTLAYWYPGNMYQVKYCTLLRFFSLSRFFCTLCFVTTDYT